MSVIASVNGNIQLTDSASGTVALQKILTSLGYTGTISSYVQSQALASGANVITLPISPVQFIYIKNLSTANTVLVTWTPNGGASNPVGTLGLNGYIMFGESNTANGITALTLTASAGSTPVEYILLG